MTGDTKCCMFGFVGDQSPVQATLNAVQPVRPVSSSVINPDN